MIPRHSEENGKTEVNMDRWFKESQDPKELEEVDWEDLKGWHLNSEQARCKFKASKKEQQYHYHYSFFGRQ